MSELSQAKKELLNLRAGGYKLKRVGAFGDNGAKGRFYRLKGSDYLFYLNKFFAQLKDAKEALILALDECGNKRLLSLNGLLGALKSGSDVSNLTWY
jgi:hypothetical protein|nr:MAG TPA: hypothetical protein [Caudoviricetes sp.]